MAVQFTLQPITAKSKGEVKSLRHAGFVPVSIQHKGTPTAHYQQEARQLDEFIKQYGKATLLELLIAPENLPQRAIVHDVQRDPLTLKLLQVTFQSLGRDDTVKTFVPIVFHGSPSDVNNSETMVQHRVELLEIECNPSKLPDRIIVDISSLRLGSVLRVSDLPTNPDYKILSAPDTALASVTSTRAGIAKEETPVEATATPVAE